MINDTLDLAKLESGKMEVRPSEFSIHSVIAGQCDLVRSLTEEKNIDLEVHVEPDLPDMFQDRGKIQQILTNLLSNAIKFTPEGGRIIVSARRKEVSNCLITVADTGVGIADEDRETIFEKFRQGSATLGKDNLTREYSGTGLGLSIVRELCRLLGGEITFESEVGKGSTFFVELPWNVPVSARRDTSLVTRLEQLTKPRRREVLAGNALGSPLRDGDAVDAADET
jgi:signal transduction histidine kinase